MSTPVMGRLDYRSAMTVDLPEMDQDGVTVERCTVGRSDSRLSFLQGRRGVPEGTYTRLLHHGRLWMSDTPAEQADHFTPIREMERRGGRVLINGLGLGMVVRAALLIPTVEHVDVVEVNPAIAAAIGPHYESDRCTVHVADAYEQTKRWPPGTRWAVAWHDIWADLCEDNLPGMARLKRSYGRRVDWQGCWGQELIQADRRRTARAWWRS